MIGKRLVNHCINVNMVYSHAICIILQLACCGILKFCLRGMLGDSRRQTLFFLDTMALACSEGVTATLIEEVDSRFHRTLALIERDFPICVQVPMLIF